MTNPVDGAANGLERIGLTRPVQERKDTLGQEDFLKIMVTQLENQDPLKPMENGEFLSQMAQFGTVSGIGELKNAFTDLAGALQSNQALQASTMVGRDVLVSGSTALLTPGAGIEGAADLPASAADVVVSIKDGAGQVIRRITLGTQEAGLVRFKWDGITDAGEAAPAGKYEITVEGIADGGATAMPVLVEARVESVTLQRDGRGPQLNLAGLGTVGMSAVRELR